MKVVATIDPALSRMAASFARLGDAARPMMAAQLRFGGETLRHVMVEAEARQTGLSPGVMDRALSGGMEGDLAYVIRSRGGNVRLKHFGAKEGGGGVTALPWGRSTFYAGAFITSGRPGARRAAPKLNGHVYERIDKGSRAWGGKIRQVRSGLYIPTEMTKGLTLAAFRRAAARLGDEVLTKVAVAMV